MEQRVDELERALATTIAAAGEAYALVMALATALHLDGALPMEQFIATLRRHALQLKGDGAESAAERLLQTAAELATNLPSRT